MSGKEENVCLEYCDRRNPFFAMTRSYTKEGVTVKYTSNKMHEVLGISHDYSEEMTHISCKVGFNGFPQRCAEQRQMMIDFYEIKIGALIETSSGTSQHVLLISDTKTRQTNEIEYRQPCNYDIEKLGYSHICIVLHRIERDRYNLPRYNDSSPMPCSRVTPDVKLIVGDKALLVNKEILSRGSEAFRALFTRMAEKGEIKVKIEGVRPEVIKQLISYLYTGRAEKLPQMPMELAAVAHKYGARGLLSQCEDYLVFALTNKNVTKVSDFAVPYGLKKLQQAVCLHLILNEKEMVKEPTYLAYLKRNLKSSNIVNTLKLISKYDLFQVAIAAFTFVKKHPQISSDQEFQHLFYTHPKLMMELFVFVHQVIPQKRPRKRKAVNS